MLLIFLKTNWGYEMCMEYWKEKGVNCPVDRKVFHAKGYEHVLDLIRTQASQSICHQNDWYASEVYLPTV